MERLGYGVERHADHFGPDEQDDSAWLTLAGKRGWAVLSADNRVLGSSFGPAGAWVDAREGDLG